MQKRAIESASALIQKIQAGKYSGPPAIADKVYGGPLRDSTQLALFGQVIGRGTFTFYADACWRYHNRAQEQFITGALPAAVASRVLS